MQFEMKLDERVVVHYCSANDRLAPRERSVVTIFDASGDDVEVDMEDVPWLATTLNALVAFDDRMGSDAS